MEDKIISIYCICQDLLSSIRHPEDSQCKMNCAEVMTIAVVAALFFSGNISRSRFLLRDHGYIPNMLSESRLNRRLHQIDISIWQTVFHALNRIFCQANESCEYLVDSMPVEVCHRVRSYRCKLLTGKKFIGFCKAKKTFYYGFKIHILSTSTGHPVEFLITPASVADITALKIMDLALAPGSTVYGDKAYTYYGLEEILQEVEDLTLIPERKTKATRQHSGCLKYLQTVTRKRIETTLSQLVSLFPRKIHAVTCAGFVLKLVIFVVSFSLNMFLKTATL